MDVGRLLLLGPGIELDQDRTCTAGQTCNIDGFSGAFQTTDTLMVLETCGFAEWPAGLPSDGSLTLSASGASFGSVVLSAPGGEYRLCWCEGGCHVAATDIGRLSVFGPRLFHQDRTCVAGQECVADGLRGHGLSSSDQWAVLSTCGASIVDGLVNAGTIASVSASGAVISFGALVNTAGGGSYRLCWCAAGATCNKAEQYKVDVGLFMLIGPAAESTESIRTCFSGQTCSMTTPFGTMLSGADSYMILATCGASGIIDGLPDAGFLSLIPAAEDNSTCVGGECKLTFGTTVVTAAGGQYRLCWCAAGRACHAEEDFKVTVGGFELIGPFKMTPGRTCIAGQTCLVDGVLGNGLADTDSIALLETCGIREVVALAPNVINNSEPSYLFAPPLTAAGGNRLKSNLYCSQSASLLL